MEIDRSRAACKKEFEKRKDKLADGLTFTAFYSRVNQLGWDYDFAATHPVTRKGLKKRPRGLYNPSDFYQNKNQ